MLLRMDTVESIKSLVKSYEERLGSVGLACEVSKKYFEEAVQSFHLTSSGFLNGIRNRKAEKLENEKYKYAPNRYHVIVLRFKPIEQGVLKDELCRDYAFFIRGVSRASRGVEPEKWDDTEAVSEKVRWRIEKVLNKAEKSTPEKVCRDRWWDLLLRYLPSSKYGYKKRFGGRDISAYEMKLSVGAIAVCAVVIILLIIGEIVTKTQ